MTVICLADSLYWLTLSYNTQSPQKRFLYWPELCAGLCKEGGVLLGCFASPTVRCYRVQSQACGSGTVLNQTVSGNANTGSIDRHTCNPRTQETEAGRPRVQLCGESWGQPGQLEAMSQNRTENQPTNQKIHVQVVTDIQSSVCMHSCLC